MPSVGGDDEARMPCSGAGRTYLWGVGGKERLATGGGEEGDWWGEGGRGSMGDGREGS